MSGSTSPGGQRRLDEFLNQQTDSSPADSLVKTSPDRCQDIAIDTSEQCEHAAIDRETPEPLYFAGLCCRISRKKVVTRRLLLAGARVGGVEPVPVARPTRELGVGVPVAVLITLRVSSPDSPSRNL